MQTERNRNIAQGLTPGKPSSSRASTCRSRIACLAHAGPDLSSTCTCRSGHKQAHRCDEAGESTHQVVLMRSHVSIDTTEQLNVTRHSGGGAVKVPRWNFAFGCSSGTLTLGALPILLRQEAECLSQVLRQVVSGCAFAQCRDCSYFVLLPTRSSDGFVGSLVWRISFSSSFARPHKWMGKYNNSKRFNFSY